MNLINKLVGANKLDVVILQETWLSNSNCHLANIPVYKHIYNHHSGHNGGGVSSLISNELTCRQCKDFCINEPYLECCSAEIQLPKQNIIVTSVYRPLNTDTLKFTKNFNSLLRSITKKGSMYNRSRS